MAWYKSVTVPSPERLPRRGPRGQARDERAARCGQGMLLAVQQLAPEVLIRAEPISVRPHYRLGGQKVRYESCPMGAAGERRPD